MPVTLSCLECGVPSGTSLVCRDCRRHLTKYRARQLIELWHEIIVARAHDPKTDRYQCFHCKDWFEKDMVCGDHFPVSKGSDENVRYDILAGKCSCRRCNTSGSPFRQASMKKPPPKVRKNLCEKCHIRLPVYGRLCIVCVQPSEG